MRELGSKDTIFPPKLTTKIIKTDTNRSSKPLALKVSIFSPASRANKLDPENSRSHSETQKNSVPIQAGSGALGPALPLQYPKLTKKKKTAQN